MNNLLTRKYIAASRALFLTGIFFTNGCVNREDIKKDIENTENTLADKINAVKATAEEIKDIINQNQTNGSNQVQTNPINTGRGSSPSSSSSRQGSTSQPGQSSSFGNPQTSAQGPTSQPQTGFSSGNTQTSAQGPTSQPQTGFSSGNTQTSAQGPTSQQRGSSSDSSSDS